MSNICAGVGRGQMVVLDERIAQRRYNFKFYEDAFSKFGGFSTLAEQDGYFSNRWLTTLLIDPSHSANGRSGEDIRLALEKENIEARPLWKPMHLQPVFSKAAYFGEAVSDGLFEKGLCLPSGSNLTKEDLCRVVQIIENTWPRKS